MPYKETDNTWVICVNCESAFSIEEFFDVEDDDFGGTPSLTKCPICGSHELRHSDSYGFDVANSGDDFDFERNEGW